MNQKVKLAGLLFVMIFSICSIWSMIAPVGNDTPNVDNAPDEGQHLVIINFLKTHHRIPIFNREDEIIKQLYIKDILGGAYYSMAYNSPVGYLPYLLATDSKTIDRTGTILKARMISCLLLATFAVFLFLSLLEMKKDYQVPAFFTAAIISLIPQVTFVGAYVNLEPFSLLIAAISFYFLNRLRYVKNLATKDYILFGVFLGILALCKVNYYIAIMYFFLVIFFDFMKEKRSKKLAFLKNYSSSLLVFIAINAWWWIRNFLLFKDPLIFGYIRKELIDKAPDWINSPHKAGYDFFSILKIPLFWEGTFKGFYAYLGGMTLKLPTQFYIIALAILIFFIVLALMRKSSRSYLFLFFITALAAIAYFVNKNLYDFSPQGRHLFPLLIPLATVIFSGMSNLKLMAQKIVGTALFVYSLVISLYCIFYMIDNFYIRGIYLVATTQPRIIDYFSWRHSDLHDFKRLFNFIFANNPSFFGPIFFYSLLAIASTSALILIFIVVAKSDSKKLLG